MTNEPDVCAVAQSDLSAYLDAVLSAESGRRLERHLAACELCRAEYEAMRELVDAVKRIPLAVPSAALRDSLLSQIDAETVVERAVTLLHRNDGVTSLRQRRLLMSVDRSVRQEIAPASERRLQRTVFRSIRSGSTGTIQIEQSRVVSW